MYSENPQNSPDYARMISENDVDRMIYYLIPEKIILGGRF